jgi:hypothetical protein
MSSEPPTIGYNAFYSVNTNIPVYVPCSAVSDYQAASGWSSFTNIQGEVGATVTLGDSYHGSVDVVQPTCDDNTATLTAMADEDFYFDHWSDGSIENPYTITVTSDTTISAYFMKLVHDTVVITYHDTVVVNNYVYDTIYLNRYIFDTVYIHDTVFVDPTGIDGIETVNAKIYQRDGRIVVESGDGGPLGEVRVFDVMGRCLAQSHPALSGHPSQGEGTGWRATFEVPASGTYMIKIGNYPARKVVVIR